MALTILDTIQKLLSEVRADIVYEELVIVMGERELRQFQSVFKPYTWRFVPLGEARDNYIKTTLFGIPIICVRDYDGVKITLRSELTSEECSAQIMLNIQER